MTGYFEWRLLAALILIALSGFFSGAEAAFFSILGRGALAGFEKDKPRLAATIREMLASPGRLISSILVGNEIVNILIAVIFASLFARGFLKNGAPPAFEKNPLWLSALSTATSAGLILVFGEVIPKTIGVRFYHKLAGLIAEPLYWFNKVIFPLEFCFRKFSQAVLKILGIKTGAARSFRQDEFAELVDAGEEEGVLEETEYALLKNVFAFGDLTAAEVMTPRQEIFSLPLDMEYSELKQKFLASGYSRIPVYQKSPEAIVGILTAKDLLKLELKPQPGSLAKLLRRPFGVPPQKKLEDLLMDFLNNNIHLALVVNEFGEVLGLVTLEDLLEEIFGRGEAGEDEEVLVETGEERWLVSGRIELRDFNERMNTFFSAPGVKTLAGYLLNEFGRVPVLDEELVRDGLRFKVKELKRRRIYRIEVEKVHD